MREIELRPAMVKDQNGNYVRIPMIGARDGGAVEVDEEPVMEFDIVEPDDLNGITNTTNLKICCVGDSLTKGGDGSGYFIDQNYPFYMGKQLNCETLNYGVGGSKPSTYWGTYISDNNFSWDASMDVVLIMFGTNGELESNTLSSDVESRENYNEYADTSVGCYCKLIEFVMEQTQNHAQIILMTPPHSARSEYDARAAATNPVVKAIAARYGLPVIDVYNESGISKFNASDLMSTDGIHFNAAGYHRLGNYIGSKVRSLLSTWPHA